MRIKLSKCRILNKKGIAYVVIPDSLFIVELKSKGGRPRNV